MEAVLKQDGDAVIVELPGGLTVKIVNDELGLRYELALVKDNDGIEIALPGGHSVTVALSDIDSGALPQLEISMSASMCANCWLDGAASKPYQDSEDGGQNHLECDHISIPIERVDGTTPWDEEDQ